MRRIQTTGFHPQSNGRLERVHATLAKMLSHFVNRHQTDWDEYLPYVTMAYNSQHHESTGYSPFELLFGRKMDAPLEGDLKITDSVQIFDNHIEALRSRLQELHELTSQHKTKARKRYEAQYNKKAKSVEFKVGQFVFLHVPSLKRHRTKKLSKLWKGPYKILEVLSPYNVVLKLRRREVVVHVNRIKPCLDRKPVQQADDVDANEGEGESTEEVAEVEEPSATVESEEPLCTQASGSAPVVSPIGAVGSKRPQRKAGRPKRLDDFVA